MCFIFMVDVATGQLLLQNMVHISQPFRCRCLSHTLTMRHLALPLPPPPAITAADTDPGAVLCRRAWPNSTFRHRAANVSEQTVSPKLYTAGEIFTNMRTFEFPPSEPCVVCKEHLKISFPHIGRVGRHRCVWDEWVEISANNSALHHT